MTCDLPRVSLRPCHLVGHTDITQYTWDHHNWLVKVEHRAGCAAAVDQILAEETVDGGTDDLIQWALADYLNTTRDIAKYDPGTDMTTVVNPLVYDTFGRHLSRRRKPAVRPGMTWSGAPSRRRKPAVAMGHGVARVSPRADARGSQSTSGTARPFDPDTGLQDNLNRCVNTSCVPGSLKRWPRAGWLLLE